MKVIKKAFSILLIGLVAAIGYGIADKKIEPDKLANKVTTAIHYYQVSHNKSFQRLNIKGIPVFVAKGLTSEEKEKIAFSINESTKALSDKELKQLSMIVYTPSNQLPGYLQNNENVNRNVNNDMTEGFYVPKLQEIYIFPDVVANDNSFESNEVMLYVTLHEIGHHIDISVKNNGADNMAEKRASRLAFNKINSLGIQLDQDVEESIIESR